MTEKQLAMFVVWAITITALLVRAYQTFLRLLEG